MAWYHHAERGDLKEMDPAFLSGLVAAGNPKAEGWEQVDDPMPGQFWNGSAWETPPAYVPPVISDRQFFHALAKQGTITQEEALAAVSTGAVPEPLRLVLDAITDPEERFDAAMLVSGAVEVRRDHPLINRFASGLFMTSEDVDQLFIYAATL